MRDLDTAFDELRHDVAGSAVGPDPGQIIRRSRRRRRIRVATGAAAAVLAVSGAVAVGTASSGDDRPVLTPPATTAPKPAPRKLKLTDLIYGKSVRHSDTSSTGHWEKGSPTDGLYVPACYDRAGDLDGDLPGTAQRLEVSYNGNPSSGNERTASQRGEQVITFVDVTTAKQLMAKIVLLAKACDKGVTVTQPAIGDEAMRASRFDQGTRGEPSQTQEAVAVRQGSAVAVYWSLRNEGPKLVDMTGLERDARVMAARLAALGYRG
jgi:hypothetical protein